MNFAFPTMVFPRFPIVVSDSMISGTFFILIIVLFLAEQLPKLSPKNRKVTFERTRAPIFRALPFSIVTTYLSTFPFIIMGSFAAWVAQMPLSEVLSLPWLPSLFVCLVVFQFLLAYFFEKARVRNEQQWADERDDLYEEKFLRRTPVLKEGASNHPYVLKAVTLNFFQIFFSIGISLAALVVAVYVENM